MNETLLEETFPLHNNQHKTIPRYIECWAETPIKSPVVFLRQKANAIKDNSPQMIKITIDFQILQTVRLHSTVNIKSCVRTVWRHENLWDNEYIDILDYYYYCYLGHKVHKSTPQG